MFVDAQVHIGHTTDGKFCSATEALDMARRNGADRIVQVAVDNDAFDNTESFDGIKEQPEGVLGIIGIFDPIAPNVEERMRRFQAQPKILGARLSAKLPPWSSGLRERRYDDYFAAAQKLDLAIQFWAPYQVPEIRETARRFPGVRMLVDHVGADRGQTEPFRQWPELLKLAEEPNVWIKVSYFPDISFHLESYPYPNAQRHFRMLYEHAGPSKLIWASNYPPILRACSYREGLEFLTVHCDFLSDADKKLMLGENFLANFAKGKMPA